MKRFKIVTLAAVAVLGLGALGGAAVRANANAGDKATAAEPGAGLPDTDNVQQGDQNGPDTPGIDKAEAGSNKADKADTDNVQVQQGDQNGPDKADKAEAGSKKAEADGPGGPNDQSGNQVEDGQPDAVE